MKAPLEREPTIAIIRAAVAECLALDVESVHGDQPAPVGQRQAQRHVEPEDVEEREGREGDTG